MDVSIIIVNYNTKEMTSKCIDSIFQNTKDISIEVILVDNASTDGSKHYFSTDDRIKYIYNDENLGFGRANNEGFKYAIGRNIFFLNSDTIIIDNSIKILSDVLDKNDNIGGCGANLYNDNMKPNISFYRDFPSIKEHFVGFYKIYNKFRFGENITFNYSKQPLEVSHISGADLMIKHNILNNIGCFNPDFFMYYEDTELCYRIKKNNYKLLSIPNAKIIHLYGKSSITKLKFIWWLDSRNMYFKNIGKNIFYRYFDLIIQKIHLDYQLIKYYKRKDLCDINKMMIHEINQRLYTKSII